MSEKFQPGRSPVEEQERMRKRAFIVVGVMLVAALLMLYVSHLSNAGDRAAVALYEEKSALLEAEVMRQLDEWGALAEAPTDAGHVVFLSLCDSTERASVYSGTGDSLQAAWDAADKAARQAAKDGLSAVWLKADVVQRSETVTLEELHTRPVYTRQEFFRWGVAFDADFSPALLEAELNSNKIFNYDEGGLRLDYLNNYLQHAARDTLAALPETVTLFQTYGWLCDEAGALHTLAADSDPDYGRRRVQAVDSALAETLLLNASDFLAAQVKEDGAFVYGYYPRFDSEIDGYNILRHAGSTWALIQRYRMAPDEALAAQIERALDYAVSQVRYADESTAYLYEEKADEYKLGGNGILIVALAEYAEAFESDRYDDLCRALGKGILSMLDQETGVYYHVLGGDFARKEAYRTVYYDGEATFALCRLYGLTGEQLWLDAAKSAADHFIAADYTQYCDQWVAYSMNELTKHVDDAAYYTFALQNAQNNLQDIRAAETTAYTSLELLMAAYETYERILERGIALQYLEEFEPAALHEAILYRAERLLDGYFFPELAMYMQNPARIVDSFMVRQDGFRVRIDDVQHNISGLYFYAQYYDAILQQGASPLAHLN